MKGRAVAFLFLIGITMFSVVLLSSTENFLRAKYLFEQGVLLEANREVSIYLNDNPDDYEANKLQAKILYQLGEFAQLRVVTERLLQMRPNDQEVLAMNERALRETQRDLPSSIEDKERHLANNPDDLGTRIRLIDIYTEQNRFAEAERHYVIIVRQRPNDAPFRLRYARHLAQRGRINQAEQEYLVYLNLQPNQTIRQEMFDVILRGAGRNIDNQEYDQAIVIYETVIERYPDELILIRDYARLLAWAERYAESIQVYRVYLDREDDSSIRLEMARTMSWANNFAAALEQILIVLDREPQNINAHILLGDLYRWTDNLDDARDKYEFALEMDPENMYANEGLVELDRMKQTRYQEASQFNIGVMRETLAEDPNNHSARLQLARLLNIAAQFQESSQHYRVYLQEKPEEVSIRLEYSRVLSSIDNYPEAVRQLKMYLDKNPEDLTSQQQLANLYLWSEDYQNAERQLLYILDNHPENLNIHWTLARLYRNREDFDKALYHLRAVRDIEPNYTVASGSIYEIENHPRYLGVTLTSTFRAPSPYRPTIGFTYSYMRDRETYSDKNGVFRYIQPLRNETRLELSYGKSYLNQKIPDSATLVLETERYTATISGEIDNRTRARFWIGYNDYESRFPVDKIGSFSLGGRIYYELDELNTIGLAYYNDDAVYIVKTIRSLELGIGVDKFEASWERLPTDDSDRAPLIEKLSFFGNFGYGMFTDNNRQYHYRVGASYPLKLEPKLDFLLGWDSLHYSEQYDSELYWSPKKHEGIFFGGKLSGSWEEFTYGADAEIAFKKGSIGASRSVSGRLYYQLTNKINTGIILSYSESPRQDDDDYNHFTSIFELYYRF